MIGKIISSIAKQHSGCSAHQDQSRYLNVIMRPSDDNGRMRNYYAGSTPPSTCALFALGCLRLAGFKDNVVTAPYQIGQAVTDVVRFGQAHKAWKEPDQVDGKFKEGSIIIVYGRYAEHVMVCTSDSRETTAGSGVYSVDSVEGGQSPDSSGIKSFIRQISKVNGKWCVGSSRIIGYVDSSLLQETDVSSEYKKEVDNLKFAESEALAEQLLKEQEDKKQEEHVPIIIEEEVIKVDLNKPVEDKVEKTGEIKKLDNVRIAFIISAVTALAAFLQNLFHC